MCVEAYILTKHMGQGKHSTVTNIIFSHFKGDSYKIFEPDLKILYCNIIILWHQKE